MALKLLGTENAKTPKGREYGYETAILYLAPHKISGRNTCPDSTVGCRASCLFTAGLAQGFPRINKARIRKTKLFYEHKSVFLDLLDKDIQSFKRYARKKRMRPCIRLNGCSDIGWETEFPVIFDKYSDIRLYDYTKSIKRMTSFINGEFPSNYYLTFSYSENPVNQAYAMELLKSGRGSVAIVFDIRKKEPMIKKWGGFPVCDGDKHDLVFLHPAGSVIGLRGKGRAKKDEAGFVQKV